MRMFICREPAVVCLNNQGLINFYGSVVSYSMLISIVLGPSKSQSSGFSAYCFEHILYLIIFIFY